MSNVGKNIVANIAGKAFSALFTFIFVPFYLKYLGIEAYGLIGFFLTLQMVLLLADLGFSGALTREVARLSFYDDSRQEMANLCRTFEIIYIILGIILLVVVMFISDFLANNWVNVENLAKDDVQKSIILMGIVISLQFPVLMYQGVLNGLQEQVLLNILLISTGLARGVGAVVLLDAVDASLEMYFEWQVLISICQLLIIRLLVWRKVVWSISMFDMSLIKPIFRFAAGMALIGITSSILIQADKLIVSKMFSLEIFGYYSLAGVLASVPMLLSGPIHNAVYPRFTQLIAEDNISELSVLYHKICQLVSVLMIPVGVVVIAYSEELLLLWTGDISTANNTFLIASVLATGSTLLGLMYIPYAIQLAYGWTSLPLIVNIIAIIILVPLAISLANLYGVLGAASVWIILNIGYVLGTIQWMHRRILPKEKLRWYFDDVGKPLLVTVAFVSVSKLLFGDDFSALLRVIWILGTLAGAFLIAAICAPDIRKFMTIKFPLRRGRDVGRYDESM